MINALIQIDTPSGTQVISASNVLHVRLEPLADERRLAITLTGGLVVRSKVPEGVPAGKEVLWLHGVCMEMQLRACEKQASRQAIAANEASMEQVNRMRSEAAIRNLALSPDAGRG